MKNKTILRISTMLALAAGLQGYAEAARTAAATPAVVIDSVIVDWVNQRFIVNGSGFTDSTPFTLAGVSVNKTLPTTSTTVYIPFDATVASTANSAGNYNLVASGVELSVYIKSKIIDRDATGCPCSGDWSAVLNPVTLWGPANRTADCSEIAGPSNYDIAGIVYSNISDPTAYPQYPIGASYYPNDPENSVCRMVELTGSSPFGTSIDNIRINQTQQQACAAALKANVCKSLNGALLP